MAADEIITRTIFKLDADEKGLFAALDSAAAKVRGTTTAFREQEKEIQDLVAREKQLLEERKKANNPNAILKYNQAIKQTRDKIADLKSQITASVDSTKKLGNEFTAAGNKGFAAGNKIKSAFNTTAINGARNSIREASSDVDKINKGFTGSKTAIEGAKKEAGGFNSVMQNVGASILAALSVGSFISIAKHIVSVRAEFQRFEAVLTNTLGSNSLAQSTLNRIQDFAAKTPFGVKELTDSFVKLANQGFRPTNQQMTALGDLAASTGKSFDQLTEAIIDAQTGEFERLKEFGIRASKEGDKVKFTFKGVQQEVKFTDQAIRDYILSLGKAEGVSGAMAAISETLGGQISNLGDNFDKLSNNVGKAIEGPLSNALGLFNTLLDESNNALDKSNRTSDNYVKAIERIAGANKELTESAKFQAEAGKLLKLFNFNVTEIGYSKVQSNIDAINKKFEENSDVVDASFKKIEAFEFQLNALNEAMKSGKINTGQATIEMAFYRNEIAKTYDELFAFRIDEETKKQNKAAEDASKKAEELKAKRKALKEQYDKEAESLERLRKKLLDLQRDEEGLRIESTLKDKELIDKRYELEIKRTEDALKEQEKNINKEFKTRSGREQALQLLASIRFQTLKNLEIKHIEDVKKFQEEKQRTIIESEKEITDAQIELAAILGETDSETYRHRYAAAEKYYNGLIDLAKQYGKSEEEINKLIAQRDLALAKLKDSEAARLKGEQEKIRTEEERHQLEMLDITKAGEEERLKLQLQFARERRDRVNDDNKATEEERLKAENAVLELETRLNQISEDKRKENLNRILDNIQTITDATLNGLQEILDAEIQAADQKIALQQSQVEKAKAIADKGNAELLQEEQERLDNLNKQKEKFVRQQQALALVELVTNSTIAIAKAAAEGGVAAPITITATLIALAAGLVKARQLAAQATFFKGGESEGYTGDGSIFDESRALGKKPYTYHKREFIFNNEKTSKYRPIFHGIHEGKIDLNEWREKVQAFDRIALNPLVYREFLPLQVERNAGTDDRSYKMLSEIHNALREQERFSLSIDERGIHAISRRLKMRGDTINKLAR